MTHSTTYLNSELASAIKSAVPDKGNVINELMDVLSIGKEAVYRRLRGEVPFTFEEAAKISLKMNVSLDNIVGLKNQQRAVFDLNLLDADHLVDNYCTKLEGFVKLFKRLNKSKNSSAKHALNTMPRSFCLPHEKLSKFRLYRWMYQSSSIQNFPLFKDMAVPSKVMEMQKVFIAESRFINKATFILDNNVFASFVRDIDYFYRLHLLTLEDLEDLKAEFLSIFDDLEDLCVSGVYKNGTEVLMYISDIDIETSYSYYSSEDYELAQMRIYSINGIDSQNSRICRIQKDWIESLKRYSVLITQSGEFRRFEYFNKQREYVNRLGGK